MQVMSHQGVDYTRTVSNHIIDIIDVLGIEAARAAHPQGAARVALRPRG